MSTVFFDSALEIKVRNRSWGWNSFLNSFFLHWSETQSNLFLPARFRQIDIFQTIRTQSIIKSGLYLSGNAYGKAFLVLLFNDIKLEKTFSNFCDKCHPIDKFDDGSKYSDSFIKIGLFEMRQCRSKFYLILLRSQLEEICVHSEWEQIFLILKMLLISTTMKLSSKLNVRFFFFSIQQIIHRKETMTRYKFATIDIDLLRIFRGNGQLFVPRRISENLLRQHRFYVTILSSRKLLVNWRCRNEKDEREVLDLIRVIFSVFSFIISLKIRLILFHFICRDWCNSL